MILPLFAIAVLLYGGWRWWSTVSPLRLAEEISAIGGTLGPELTDLSLKDATLTESLACQIASVRSIRSIVLTNCRLSGKDLRRITDLPRLANLTLVDCVVTEADTPWGTSESLDQIVVRGTKLSGSELPRFVSRQAHLERLMLENTGLGDEELQEWQGSPEATRIDLREPNVHVAGLRGLKRCRALEALSLAGSGVEDEGLAVLAWMGSLRSLDLSGCTRISGAGLKHSASLEGLQTIDLSASTVNDEGLKNLELGFSPLQKLILHHCASVTDSSLQSIARLPHLFHLDLSNTSLSGGGLRALRGHRALARLDLHQTPVTDAAIPNLAGLPELATLDISHTPVTDRGFDALKNCRSLERLAAVGCAVTNEGMAVLSDLRSLRSLDLSDCSAIGPPILNILQGLPRLRVVSLKGTGITSKQARDWQATHCQSHVGFEYATSSGAAIEAASPF